VQRNVALILQKKQVKCNVFIRCFCMDCNILYRRMVRSCTLEGREIFGMCYVLQDVVAVPPSAVELWKIADRAAGVLEWSEDGGLEVERCGEGLAGACSWSGEG